jgi:hypothetical protein
VFSESSRYSSVPRRTATARDGREVHVVGLRRFPDPDGVLHEVMQNDRLDVISQRRYQDPTRFWRIADANTELEADALLAEPGRHIEVPEQ